MSIANTPSSNDFDRLSTQLARFEALFEAVPLAIAVFDEDLRLIRANDRYRDLTSLAPTQSFARPIYDAFTASMTKAHRMRRIERMKGRTARRVRYASLRLLTPSSKIDLETQ